MAFHFKSSEIFNPNRFAFVTLSSGRLLMTILSQETGDFLKVMNSLHLSELS